MPAIETPTADPILLRPVGGGFEARYDKDAFKNAHWIEHRQTTELEEMRQKVVGRRKRLRRMKFGQLGVVEYVFEQRGTVLMRGGDWWEGI
jgi:hypothetical protein